VFYEAEEAAGTARATKATSRPEQERSSPVPDPAARTHRVEVRDDGDLGARAGHEGVGAVPSASSAVVVYVIILVAFQVFLITVAVEAFQTDEETLAWSTAAVSVVLAGSSAALRYLRP
jgi:hypothetical protein